MAWLVECYRCGYRAISDSKDILLQHMGMHLAHSHGIDLVDTWKELKEHCLIVKTDYSRYELLLEAKRQKVKGLEITVL